jgi:hypothetical protein
VRDYRADAWAELAEATAAGDAHRDAMAKLSDEERRALNVLARHHDGCDEAVLLADGFTVRQLAGLVIDGFAALERKGTMLWMRIIEAGRKALAE